MNARWELLQRRLAAAGLAADPAQDDTGTAAAASAGLGTAERRMWKIHQLDPESISHNIGLILTFAGGYTVERVVAAFELMVRGAEVLGSVVVDDEDGPRRTPVERSGRWIIPGRHWTWGDPPAGDEPIETPAHPDAVAAVATRLAQAGFDLTRQPPLRALVCQGGAGTVAVVLVIHHLAVDDTSWPLLLGTLTSGARPAADTVQATAKPAAGAGAVERALRHATDTWAADDVRYPLSGSLPADTAAHSWLAPLVDRRGIRLVRPVDPDDVAALGEVSREVGATLNALLIAVCAAGVHVLTGSADHVLLVPADNRHPGQPPDRVGYCGNIIPMRFGIDPQSTVRETLRDAVSAVYRAMEFSTVDYGAVLTALRRAGGRFPVAEIMASVRNAPLRGIPIPADGRVRCETVFNGVGNYPLTFAFEIDPDGGVQLETDYQPDVVDERLAESAPETIAALVQRIPRSLDLTMEKLALEVRTETAPPAVRVFPPQEGEKRAQPTTATIVDPPE